MTVKTLVSFSSIAALILMPFSATVVAQQAPRSERGAQGARGDQPPVKYFASQEREQSRPLSLAQNDSQDEEMQGESSRSEMYEESETSSESMEDDVAARQSVDAFISLEDGQPGDPGELELKLNLGWQTTSGEHDPITLLTELQYTPDGNDFLRNMQLILGVPVVMGLGAVDGNADIEFGWQQRWITEEGAMPSISTLAEIRIPSGYHSSGVDGALTGIVAKDLGPGTMYVNGFVKTANGNNIEDLRHFQWGASAGYKWRVNDQFALIGDYAIKSSEQEGHADINVLEFAGQYEVNEHLTIGPGIVIGLDDNDETPNFGAGVTATVSF